MENYDGSGYSEAKRALQYTEGGHQIEGLREKDRSEIRIHRHGGEDHKVGQESSERYGKHCDFRMDFSTLLA